jgi:hypothetical protein
MLYSVHLIQTMKLCNSRSAVSKRCAALCIMLYSVHLAQTMKLCNSRSAVSKISRDGLKAPVLSISSKKKGSSSKASCKKHCAGSSKDKSGKRSHTGAISEPLVSMPLSSTSIRGATSRLSKSLMAKLRSSESCEIVSEGGGDITIFKFGYESEAFNLWKEHYLPKNKEKDVLDNSDPVFIITPAFGGANVPPLAAVGPILQAVAKALVSYAPLRKADFAGGALPFIPAAHVVLPPLGVKFHHATIAAYKVLERIQTGAGLPDILALPAGTNIVGLNVVYSNCALSILLVKS